MRYLIIVFVLLTCVPVNAQNFAFKNKELPVNARVADLLQQLTLEEKISLLGNESKAVDRLGIPAYNWWSEGLHGVARAGNATVFPQAIGMAASFNDELLKQCADVISTEARAKYNLSTQQGRYLQYMGLTFWSPNINIFRDPRWGRGSETYGEDPFLTAAMGTAFVQGMQGNDANFLKTAACAKHLAVHSGPEGERHGFNAIVDEKDLRETYLYAFKKLADAGVESIMCAYNRINNEPCCSGNNLLHNIVHEEWKFKGHIVTDCGALYDILNSHKTYATAEETAAAAIKAGINLECGGLLQSSVLKAVQQKLLTETDIDSALAPIFRTQMKLGMFDVKGLPAYASYGADSITNSYHTQLARTMAQQSMVLLKNNNNVLPLDKSKYNAYMVVGPNASSLDALVGSYHGVSSNTVDFVTGITNAVDAGVRVEYDMGCDYIDTTHFGGIWAAGNADITIAILGLTPVYEGEEGDAFLSECGGDRKNMSLPASHIAYLKALRKGTKTPIVAVITAGSAIDISAIEPYADAIIFAWYPGEQGGNALADILFGKVSPSGKLPLTFYNALSDLPDYKSYAMQGRTYRYYNGNIQYPFGFGLSYTSFKYAWKQQPNVVKTINNTLHFSVKIQNAGNYDGSEVAQVYIQYPSLERMPLKELKAFKKVFVQKNNETTVSFAIPVAELQKWDMEKHAWKLYNGTYKIVVGSNSKDEQLSSVITIAAKGKR